MALSMNVHTMTGGVDAADAATVHREAHGLVADEIHAVSERR